MPSLPPPDAVATPVRPDDPSPTAETRPVHDAASAGLGRERTVVESGGAGAGPGYGGDAPDAELGRERTRERTLETAPSPHDDPATEATVAMEAPGAAEPPGGSLPATPTTANPRSRRGARTTTSMDDGWHYQGRKGDCTGKVWDDFDVGGVIGEGGMGTVYRAKQISLKRRVALKVLSPLLANEPRLLARFRIEATAASKLQTPHVVQVHAIGEEEGFHFYAMEFVDGCDLQAIIREHWGSGKALPPEQSVGLILQAAKGLAEAGRNGIVHRDIKPSNLMVTKDGLLKVADFGIARILGEHQLTVTGSAIGTPSYSSPEQGRGDREIDARSDIYSLGVVFYELSCGRKPFQGATSHAMIYQHCYEEPRLPKAVNPGITDEIQAVILRCLQKKPENRYQSAEELIADLDAIHTGQMLKTAIAHYRLGTGADEAKREQLNWVQRHLRLIAALFLLLASIGLASSWGLLHAKQQELTSVRQGMMSVSEQRAKLIRFFDAAIPPPEDAQALLDDFVRRVAGGERDADLQRWRDKLRTIARLEDRLSRMTPERPTAKVRQSGLDDYQALVAKVGPAFPAVAKAKAWLDAQEETEKRLRNECAPLMTMVDLRLAASRRFREAVDSLSAMVPDDDVQLIMWRKRLDDFAHDLDVLRTDIAPLERLQVVSRADRDHFQPIYDRLASFIDADDAAMQGWSRKLNTFSERIRQVRQAIVEVVGPQPDRIPTPDQDRIADQLDEYRTLVGSNDVQLQAWDAAIKATGIAIDGARKRLEQRLKDTADGLLPQPFHAACERDTKLLASLVGIGDGDLLRYERTLNHSRNLIERMRNECSVLEPGNAAKLSLMVQRDLKAKVELLAIKGGVEATRIAAWNSRLEEEARRVGDLRTALRSSFSAAVPITSGMCDDLAQLSLDAPADDQEVRAWTGKRKRVAFLLERLSVLDRPQPLPDTSAQMLVELTSLIGEGEPQVVAWRRKLARIDELQAELRVLDERRPFDARTMAAGLAALPPLISTADRKYQQWKAKVDEVERITSALATLSSCLALGERALAEAHESLRRLVQDLVGADDAMARDAARRLMELEGPPRPAWATATGRDECGLWAEAALPGGALRFRYLAPGTVLMGSPESEPGRDADEMQVAMTLPRGFWIAEVETPRGIWSAMMKNDPSRTPLTDPTAQPAERMSWDDAVRFCQELTAAIPRFPVRLPLEAEWEYACRAGSTAAWTLPDGSPVADEENVGRMAWHAGNAGKGARPSRSRLPNPLGLYDMQGNLAEWCADAYLPYPTSATTVTAPATGGVLRVLRGGSWGDSWLKTRAANRISADASIHSAFVGVRLAVDADWMGRAADGGILLAGLAAESGNGDAPRLHHVADGDSLSSIAAAMLGDADAWPVLIAANLFLSEAQHLPVGSWLVVPPRTWRSYRIRSGDTPESIAASQLGEPGLGADLLAVNPWMDAGRNLPPGRLVLLPVRPRPEGAVRAATP